MVPRPPCTRRACTCERHHRSAAPGAVAPFFYSFAIWAVIAGVIVFRELPNPLALVGIAAIVASGLGIVLLDRRITRTPARAVPE